MSKILFYSPFEGRSRDTESLMLAFSRQGHLVYSLSQRDARFFHNLLKAKGVNTYSSKLKFKLPWIFETLWHLLYLIYLCHLKRIDTVYSHLEPANFVAVMAQFFIRSKVYVCRHHVNDARLYGFDKSLSYRLTYRLARDVIVVSRLALNYMKNEEKINPKKLIHINLAYDFTLYDQVDPKFVDQLRNSFGKKRLILLGIGRLVRFKRLEILIELVSDLKSEGIDSTLILLGHGELRNCLEGYAQKLGVNANVIFPGYVSNVLDYLSACDFFIHPSVAESSCVSVKEAGLVRKPVLVCKGVGDFDDYLIDGENAFLLNSATFKSEALNLIRVYRHKKEELALMGSRLESAVIKNFGLQSNIEKYTKLNLTTSKRC